MNPQQLAACMGHLEAAELVMTEARDLPGLVRLSLVIEILREEHGLPYRQVDPAASVWELPPLDGTSA